MQCRLGDRKKTDIADTAKCFFIFYFYIFFYFIVHLAGHIILNYKCPSLLGITLGKSYLLLEKVKELQEDSKMFYSFWGKLECNYSHRESQLRAMAFCQNF